MNVSGVGGAASLPMTLPPPAHLPGTTAGATSGGTLGRESQAGAARGAAVSARAVGGSQAAVAGELRLPGQKPAASESASTIERRKEKAEPAPLPPLPGLTVAEIRAMLGVVSPQSEAAMASSPDQAATSTALQAAASRYV
jgi:hypothetical protein